MFVKTGTVPTNNHNFIQLISRRKDFPEEEEVEYM